MKGFDINNNKRKVRAMGAMETFSRVFQHRQQLTTKGDGAFNRLNLPRRQRNRIANIETSALQTVAKMWADSGWTSKNNIWKRFHSFCSNNGLNPMEGMDYNAMLFVESTAETTCPATRARYVSDLSAIAKQMGTELKVASMYRRGLSKMGANIPENQARPISLEELRRLCLKFHDGDTKLAMSDMLLEDALLTLVFLMWKTCSRFDEVANLMGDQVVSADSRRIIINWRDNTKTTKSDPFRMDSQIIVRDATEIPERVVECLNHLARCARTRNADGQITATRLFSRNSDWFRKWLTKVLPAGPGEKQLTAHSFKRAGLTRVAEAVADGLLPAHVLGTMAKHKSSHPTFEGVTLRYLDNVELKARLVGTERATIVLPWW